MGKYQSMLIKQIILTCRLDHRGRYGQKCSHFRANCLTKRPMVKLISEISVVIERQAYTYLSLFVCDITEEQIACICEPYLQAKNV